MKIFINAKVNDSVYSIIYGSGRIESVGEYGTYNDPFPLVVRFNESCGISYSLDGKTRPNQEVPDLYWEKPIILHVRRK